VGNNIAALEPVPKLLVGQFDRDGFVGSVGSLEHEVLTNQLVAVGDWGVAGVVRGDEFFNALWAETGNLFERSVDWRSAPGLHGVARHLTLVGVVSGGLRKYVKKNDDTQQSCCEKKDADNASNTNPLL